MKVSLNWLRDFVDVSTPVEKLAEKLTMAGLEVSHIDVIGGAWQNVLIGKILSIGPHPNADRLRLVGMDLGAEKITVVTGAPNIREGMVVPFAKVGARLIDGHTGQTAVLKPAKIRGVVSEGMVCSEKELGISDNHEGIMELPGDAPIGAPLADYMGDTVLDIEVTPNRPDCLNVVGIAWETAAHLNQQVRWPDLSYAETGEDINGFISVEIASPELCGRYTASLIRGVKIGPSPQWMQKRLSASGMRPINNIVDVTNYVMLELGQPLHAFDYSLIRGKKIIVRRVRSGDAITTLDGTQRALGQDMLAIADAVGPVAVAGVMGGANSEVSDATRDVLLESASFNPTSIRQTSAALQLRSEASMRFERGISIEYPLPALKRATRLMVEIAGGKAAKGIIDVYPGKKEEPAVVTSVADINRLLGTDFSPNKVTGILSSLGFTCEAAESGRLNVKAPYWRTDIRGMPDLAEEVARIAGYDEIPVRLLGTQIPSQQADRFTAVRERIRDVIIGCGFQECVSYSMISLARIRAADPDTDISPVHITNPMSPDQEYLRTSLRPGLLAILARNQKHEPNGIRLFELARVFLPVKDSLPDERQMLCATASGSRFDSSWLVKADNMSFFDARGVADTLLSGLHAAARFEAIESRSFYPGKAARIMVGGEAVGVVGELHPSVVEKFDLLPQPVLVLEIDATRLAPLIPDRPEYRVISRYPTSPRDLAIIVGRATRSSAVSDAIASFPLVTSVRLFDVFTGGKIDPDKKSLAYRIIFQSPSRTLSDQDIEKAQESILRKLKTDFGADLRT